MRAEYRVLGPLEVLLDGEPVAVPAGRGRVLLATLLLRANEFVPVDELIERIWDGEPPAGDRVHKTLQMTVSRLRQALGEANCVQTSSRGYSAAVSPGQLDLARFRALTAQSEHRAALELWRGPVLANVASESLHRDDVPPLAEEQVVALERRIDQDLRHDTDALVPELRALVGRYPLRETFWAQLMLALHRSNRQAEALAVYQEIREHLADELGVDPGQRLREAHEQVLSGQVPTSSVPRQLPAGVPHFVGREDELARLTDMLATRPGEPVLISAINGIGGVGKTALALQWAHQVTDRFPDGQLYVNLRGFDPRADPLDPLTVVRDFLLALGVPAKDVPSSEDALIASYRSALAERRVMLVLDNARDVDQVRPLLPGGAANLVLITSRNRLRGLVAREGARPVALDVLDVPAAVDLLTERIGAARIAADSAAVSRLVERCAGLPLALSIVAARAACGDSLVALADELAQERLDALDIDDPTTGVRSVLSWSLRSVSDAATRVFVLLGLHPGPDFTVAAAASLAALPLTETRRALNELMAGSLLGTVSTARFVLHDLVRDYAVERVAILPEEPRAEALRRMLDHYLHSTYQAWLVLDNKALQRPTLTPPVAGVVVVSMTDYESANDWYAAELQVLLWAVTHAEADEVVWPLGFMMHLPLLRGHRLDEAEAVERIALAAAERREDTFGQARLHRSLAGLYIRRQSFADAEFHLRTAMRGEAELGDPVAESNLVRGLAYVYELQGKYEDALGVLLEIHPRTADLPSDFERACHLSALGDALHRVGQSGRGLEFCLRAVELFTKMEDLSPELSFVATYETLGDIYLALDRPAEAVDSYHESVRLMRKMRDAYKLAQMLVALAKALLEVGKRGQGREHLGEALSLYEKLGHEKATEVRELLASLD